MGIPRVINVPARVAIAEALRNPPPRPADIRCTVHPAATSDLRDGETVLAWDGERLVWARVVRP